MFRMLNNSAKRITARRIPFIVSALLFGLLFTTPLYAVIVGAGQFDQLIQNAKIIVKAQVTQTDKPPFEMIAFRAEIITVLKSDGAPIPNHLALEAAAPIWPKDFGIPFEEKKVVLLVLRRANGKLAIVNNLRTILPATNSKIHHENHISIKRKVFNELRAFLPQAKDKLAKGLILVHLSQLASKEDEKIFLPYMESTDKQLRRSALASLLRINPTPERIQVAVADFNDHLSTPPKPSAKDHNFWRIYDDVRWAARCGAWGMEKNLTARARAYLPIYRVLIDKAPPDYQRIYVAIEALKNVGTREDIQRLYKYLDHKKAWVRHDVLEGLGRILGMKTKRPSIISYEMPLPPNVEPWERKTRAAIEGILADEDLIGKAV